MSETNMELVRTALAAWNAADVEALVELGHPEYELRTSGVYPGLQPVYRGSDGLREFWRDWAELWEDLTLEVEELLPKGDQVLALLTFRARGREGVEVSRPTAALVTVRDGLVLRQSVFGSWDEGRRAAGLNP